MGHTSGIKIAAWARAEERKQARAEHRQRVRTVFGFLFGLAVLVFIYSDHKALQDIIYSKVGPMLVKLDADSALKWNALHHQNEINDINNR